MDSLINKLTIEQDRIRIQISKQKGSSFTEKSKLEVLSSVLKDSHLAIISGSGTRMFNSYNELKLY